MKNVSNMFKKEYIFILKANKKNGGLAKKLKLHTQELSFKIFISMQTKLTINLYFVMQNN